MPPPVDLKGQRFGMLVACRPTDSRRKGQVVWLMLCDCGREKLVPVQYFKKGRVQSCGCNTLNLHKRPNTKNKTHGMRKTSLYNIWVGMRDRCGNRNSKAWKHYGGRGISVCDSWRVSFEAFSLDMGPSYSQGMTIERVNNDVGYSKENCVWIPREDQNKNKRNVKLRDTPWGKMSIAQAARKIGVNHATLWGRVAQGWPTELLFSPKGSRLKKLLSDPSINPPYSTAGVQA